MSVEGLSKLKSQLLKVKNGTELFLLFLKIFIRWKNYFCPALSAHIKIDEKRKCGLLAGNCDFLVGSHPIAFPTPSYLSIWGYRANNQGYET